MKKNYIYFISLAVIVPVFQFILPWWLVVIKVFFINLVIRPGAKLAALGGFVVPATIWMLVAYYTHVQSQGRISELLGALLGGISPVATIILTGILIGLICIPFSISGNNLGKMLLTNRQ